MAIRPEDQPAEPGRSGHRPLGDDRRIRQPRAFQLNVDREYERNIERYAVPEMGPEARSKNFRVVPPGTGICHQVNLEYLARPSGPTPTRTAPRSPIPDTLVGTDSHTTMVNGLASRLGRRRIEAEAAMLGQPISMLIPEVVGFKLTGKLREGRDRHRPGAEGRADAAQARRGRQVRRFYGEGLDHPAAGRPRHHRQHGPEYGATCGFFPVDGRRPCATCA